MKRKVIAAILASAMLATATAKAYAAGNPLDRCSVTVYDWSTPATFSAGKNWPITTWYFYGEDGQVLGSISGNNAMSITQATSPGNIAWETWFADAFNEYRENAASTHPNDENTFESESSKSVENGFTPTIPNLARPQDDFDAENLAMEIIELTNSERETHGLLPLPIDQDLMELAQLRAEEVSKKYSHERPDGTTVVVLGCGENVGARATAEKQVESWMKSEGHRRNILLERYKVIGAGCFKAENGRIYWVEVFSA